MTDAYITAEKLLQVNALQLNLYHPFTWASGWKSPIYCDNRKVLSHPMVRDYIKSELSNVVFEKFIDAELIAAVATAGIPWGAMIADQLKLPFIYVRPKPKDHGLQNQIEGVFVRSQKTVIVEDLISTGKSSLQVINVLKGAGLDVSGLVSIFNYRFSIAEEAFTNAAVQVYSLSDYPTLLQIAEQKGLIHLQEQEVLSKWRLEPHSWKGLS